MSENIYPRKIIGIAMLFFIVGHAFGQSLDLEKIKPAKGVKLSGGLSFNTVFNSPAYQGVQPLSLFLSGTLNLNLYGVNIPIILSYSNRKFAYSQPYSFNQLSLHPTYKWATAHIGTNFTSFSPYSLNGHQYQGIGFDLSPNRWNISLMAGRLVKAQTSDTLIGPTYKRMGYGVKTTYRGNNYRIGLTAFGASDDLNSINATLSKADKVLDAQSNLVLGLQFGATLFKVLQLDLDYHNSVLTTNKEAQGDEKVQSLAGWFYPANSTTKSYNAFKANLNYNLAATKTLIGVGYERVDPFYRTLGGYFFVNDFENWTINFNQTLWKDLVSINGNLGLQNSDIKKAKSNGQKRVVGSVNLNANITDKWSIGGDYSNFTSYSYIRTVFDDVKRLTPFDQLDTLRYTQISNNLSFNSIYNFHSTETKNDALVANIAFMTSADKQGDIVRVGRGSNFINSTVSYSSSLLQKYIGYSVGVNYSYNTIGAGNITTVGPVLGFQKGFLQNALRTNFSASYLFSQSSDAQSNNVNLRVNANYTIKKQHSLVSNLGFSHTTYEKNSRSYVSLSFGYNYSF